MDEIAIDKIKEFEQGLVEYTERAVPAFFKEVKEKGMYSEEAEGAFKKALEDFKNSFAK